MSDPSRIGTLRRMGALRPSLTAIAVGLGLPLCASLAAAVGVPAATSARLLLVVAAWAALTLLLAFVFLPGFDLLPGRIARRVPGPSRVALTIDDGPHPDTTPALLDALARAEVRATFFLVGAAVERWPELARRIVAAGHDIGNHTQHHRLLAFRTADELAGEIADCQRALSRLVPEGAIRWFRPPHGFKPIGLSAALRPHGLRMAAWQGSIRDTDAPGVETIVARAVALARPGRILLLHDNPSCRGQTAAALPMIVRRYRDLGLEFSSLDGS